VQREISDHNKIAREAFRPEGNEQKAPRLQVLCEGSPGNVVEVFRKPSPPEFWVTLEYLLFLVVT
jgi:hypothetical protein